MFEQIKRIEPLDNLIRLRATGSLAICARTLGISVRQLFRMLEEMKDHGVPINYDKYRSSYYYTHIVKWKFGFKVKKHR